MYHTIAAFALAVVLAGKLPELPSDHLYLIVIPFCCLGFLYRRTRPMSALVLGLVVVIWTGERQLNEKLNDNLQGMDLVIEGYIYALPRLGERRISFPFKVVESEDGVGPGLITLSWYIKDGENAPKAGEKWRLVVRLNRPHGSVNPGLFDYEAWMLANSRSATGYVRSDSRNELLENRGWYLVHHQIREQLRTRVTTSLPDGPVRALLIALLIGDSSGIDPTSWQILSDTGTNHLFIVSGLHIGLVAGIFLTGWRIVLRRVTSHWRIQAGLLSLVFTFGFGFIAGMGLPVQRSLAMVAIAMIALVLERVVTVWLVFAYALLVVIINNPFVTLGAGFWLSFGAVASLVFAFSGRKQVSDNILKKAGSLLKTQWVVFIAIAPLLICWVMQVSLVSFFVNLAAIPIVALMIVPTLLIAIPFLLAGIEAGSALLLFAYHTLTLLLWFLELFADLNWVLYRPGTPIANVLLACVGSLLLIAPRGFVPKWTGILFLLPVIAPDEMRLKVPELSIQVLDVGQGLSIIFGTRNHVVVYDAGPAFSGRFDAGERIVAPSLKMSGYNKVHTLVISHSDSDHAGGVNGLQSRIPIIRKLSSSQILGPRCETNQVWEIDDIRFTILLGGIDASDNNQSCVLLVQAGEFAMLVPGDIELLAEQMLLDKELPFIDVMISPHHGSLSSSSPAFLNHVAPNTIIVSAGYMNRFNHPHPRVLARYEARQVRILNTAKVGSIVIYVTDNHLELVTARSKYRRFWYD